MKFDSTHLREILRGTGIAVLLRGAGAVLAFAFNVTIARLLGPNGAGIFFIALSFVTVSAVVGKLGLENTLLRFVSTGRNINDWSQVKSIVYLAIKLGGITSFGIALILFMVAPLIAEYLVGDLSLIVPLRILSFTVFNIVITAYMAESLKALKLVRQSMLVSGVFCPAAALILVWPLVITIGPNGAALAYMIGTSIAASFGYLYWRNAVRGTPGEICEFDRSTLWQSCRPLWAMSIINGGILPWAPLLFLAIWGTTEDAGIFGAASRVAMLGTFFLVTVNITLAPKLVELHTSAKLEQISGIAKRIVLLTTLSASPLLCILIFKGDVIMGFFGQGFERGGSTLAILAVGQAVVCVTGVAGQILMMTGNERHMRSSSLLALAMIMISSFLLIPPYGTVGAAIANTIAISCMGIYQARSAILFLRRHRLEHP
jgi:O-antigen/teichoic acid export membrane protein